MLKYIADKLYSNDKEVAIHEIGNMNMTDFWMDIQLWAISATQIILSGEKEPPALPNGPRRVHATIY